MSGTQGSGPIFTQGRPVASQESRRARALPKRQRLQEAQPALEGNRVEFDPAPGSDEPARLSVSRDSHREVPGRRPSVENAIEPHPLLSGVSLIDNMSLDVGVSVAPLSSHTKFRIRQRSHGQTRLYP